MNPSGKRFRFTLLAIVSLVIAAGALCDAALAATKDSGTRAQRRACRPDAFRLCSAYFPFPDPVKECLQRNKRKLSPACRAVFEGRL
jgi:hypothetical protein